MKKESDYELSAKRVRISNEQVEEEDDGHEVVCFEKVSHCLILIDHATPGQENICA